MSVGRPGLGGLLDGLCVCVWCTWPACCVVRGERASGRKRRTRRAGVGGEGRGQPDEEEWEKEKKADVARRKENKMYV